MHSYAYSYFFGLFSIMTRVLKASYLVENMIEAVRTGISIHEAASKYGVPRSTLGDSVNGQIYLTARPGRDPVFPKEVEDSMVVKAMSRADQGFGLSKRTMIACRNSVQNNGP